MNREVAPEAGRKLRLEELSNIHCNDWEGLKKMKPNDANQALGNQQPVSFMAKGVAPVLAVLSDYMASPEC